MRLAIALGVLMAVAVGGAARAQAQPSAADRQKAAKLYDEGQRHYNAGEYDQAIEKFRQSYYLSNEPLLLFNIGQALRLKGDCGQALHSYRAYLRERAAPDNKKQVDEAIAICEAKMAEDEQRAATEQEAAARKERKARKQRKARESGEGSGGGDRGEAAGGGGGDDAGGEDGDIEDSLAPPARRQVFATRAAVGPALLSSIDGVDGGVLLSGAFGVGVPFRAGRALLDAGALVTYTRVPWSGEMGDPSGTAGLTGLLANVGASIPLGAGPVALRLDAGAGILVLSGVTPEANPFLNHGERATGALRMLHARLGAGLEVAVSSAVTLLAQPVVAYSPATDLRDDIAAIIRFDLLVGAALRI